MASDVTRTKVLMAVPANIPVFTVTSEQPTGVCFDQQRALLAAAGSIL